METGRLVNIQTSRRDTLEAKTSTRKTKFGRRRKNGLWLAWVWIVVVILLVISLRQSPFEQIFTILSRLKHPQILVLVGLNLFFIFLVNIRWWLLQRSFGYSISIFSLLAYRLAGFGVSYITPGPQFGGEPLQVFMLHKHNGVPVDVALTGVYLDRIIDLLSNFTFLFIGSIVIVLTGLFHGWINQWIGIVSFSLMLLPAGHIIALFFGRRPATWLLGCIRWAWINKARDIVARSEVQIADFLREKPWTLAGVIAVSGLIWMGAVIEFWLCLKFLGIDAGISEAISALTAARLALLVPVPGGLGALETSQFLAADLLGWGAAAGIAVSMVIRSRDILLALVGLGIGAFLNRSLLIKP